MSIIYLARHGETTWNAVGRYQGRLESDLSDRGIAQAQALADAFTTARRHDDAVPTRIISSPLRRCQATVAPLAARLEVPIETDDRLIEIGHGLWEGLFRDEIAERYPEIYRLWREHPSEAIFPEGERLHSVAARWASFAEDLAARDENTLVATHDAVVRIALLALTERPLDDLWQVNVENAAFSVLTRNERPDGTRSLQLQEALRTEHLGGLRASIADQAL